MSKLKKLVAQGVPITFDPATYIGKLGEVTVDFGIQGLHYHDGLTPGGVPIGAGQIITISSTSYTLTLRDNGCVLAFTSGSPITLSVPTGLGGGFQCAIAQIGAGAITPAATGTTIHNRQSQTATAGQYALTSLVAYAADTFIFAGDTA